MSCDSKSLLPLRKKTQIFSFSGDTFFKNTFNKCDTYDYIWIVTQKPMKSNDSSKHWLLLFDSPAELHMYLTIDLMFKF